MTKIKWTKVEHSKSCPYDTDLGCRCGFEEVNTAIKSCQQAVKESEVSREGLANMLFKRTVYLEMYGKWEDLPEGHQRVFLDEARDILAYLKESA